MNTEAPDPAEIKEFIWTLSDSEKGSYPINGCGAHESYPDVRVYASRTISPEDKQAIRQAITNRFPTFDEALISILDDFR